MSPPPLPVGKGRGLRRRRVAAIKTAVRAGTYRIPAELVAAAMLGEGRKEADPG